MDAVRQYLHGRADRLHAFAQSELERAWELERSVIHLDGLRVGIHNWLLEKHREVKARLAAKEEALCLAGATTAEVPNLRTRLVEAGQQRDQTVTDNGQLRAEVEQLKAESTKAAKAHQVELVRLQDEHGKVAALRDDELKAAVDKIAELEKALEARDRAGDLEQHGMLCEAQHLDELLVKYFPETQETVDEAMLTHRSTQADAGARVDPVAAWTFPEIMHAAEVCLTALDKQTARLSEVGLGMVAALWPGVVAPDSFTRLARWQEVRPARLHAWRVSAARAGADLALRFIMSWYPGLNLNQLAAQQAGAKAQLEVEAHRIAARASYLASFAAHEEF